MVLTGVAATDTTTIQNAFNTYFNIHFSSGLVQVSTVLTETWLTFTLTGAGATITLPISMGGVSISGQIIVEGI